MKLLVPGYSNLDSFNCLVAKLNEPTKPTSTGLFVVTEFVPLVTRALVPDLQVHTVLAAWVLVGTLINVCKVTHNHELQSS